MKQIILRPEFENDGYYFILFPGRYAIKKSVLDLKYLVTKIKAFSNKDIAKEPFLKFANRPSLRNIYKQKNMIGSIYTRACEIKNEMAYEELLRRVKYNKECTRRCVITMADSTFDYLDPRKDVSCLNIIHYMPNKVTLFFRASDIKNELLYDLITIKQFFIDPVYDNKPEIHVIASTAQNVDNFKSAMNLIIEHKNLLEFFDNKYLNF